MVQVQCLHTALFWVFALARRLNEGGHLSNHPGTVRHYTRRLTPHVRNGRILYVQTLAKLPILHMGLRGVRSGMGPNTPVGIVVRDGCEGPFGVGF